MNGTVRQRNKGSWEIRYSPPADGSGSRKYLSETVRGTKAEAQVVLRDRIKAIETGSYVIKNKETVAEFMERWLATYAATNTNLKTQQGYRGVIARHIVPALGSIKLQNLTARQIQSLYAEMQSRETGTSSILATHRVLKEALGHAVKWNTITRNVADGVSPPRVERKTMPMWNVSDINHFLDATTGNHFFPVYHLAVLTGLRRSEIFGLKWDAVDLAGATLRVVRTLQRITDHGLVEGQPKTDRSRRSIALSPAAVELLHGVRGTQMEHQLDYGVLWSNTGYVFTQLDGSPIDPDRISKEFPKLVKAHGLPHLTFHGLRHAHATLALSAGINPKIVSERLGHSSIAVTMDIYSHVLPGMQEEAALAVERLLDRPASG
jgi:integrase